jgi:hypothetical protein
LGVDQEVTPGLQHTAELAHDRDRSIEVFEHVLREHEIELAVAVRQRREVGDRGVGEVGVVHDGRVGVGARHPRHEVPVVVRIHDPAARAGVEDRGLGAQVPTDRRVEPGMLVDVARVEAAVEPRDGGHDGPGV